MFCQMSRGKSSENYSTFLLLSYIRLHVKTFQLLNKDYLINHPNLLISRGSCKNLKGNEITISVFSCKVIASEKRPQE